MDFSRLEKQVTIRKDKENKTARDGANILRDSKNLLKDGKSVFGLTMGYISLIQIVEMVAKNFGGNFDFSTSVWSCNQVDVARIEVLKQSNLLNSIRFLIDPSAYSRKFEAVSALYTFFGIESVRSIPTHAKFVTLKNDKHSFCIISSMNFTHNPRLEQFQIFDCGESLNLLNSVVDAAFSEYGPSDNFTGNALIKFNEIKKVIAVRNSDGLDLDLDLDFF